MHQTALCQTGLLWIGPCKAKPRPTSPNHHVRSLLFSDIMQQWVVIPYRCFQTTYWSHLQR